ncbi:hypothetical protein G8764_07880 [Pseudomaricurvus alcaniphilus]|uniref:hypothetical protein n=1 Tax=Pseudomaricurvus alcaniphilus TaxID=1166482 RepID=UPI00140BA1A6|nr:hypothetical protein [Pseudomaricurvus alcaniphilus]NHN37204.1 hypothetical protein [Pseudomaricurvus alcaniphilus]
MLYELRIISITDSETSKDEYDFVVNDLIVTLADRLALKEAPIIKEADIIIFNCDLYEKEIKKNMKDVFFHHSDVLRFVSLDKC